MSRYFNPEELGKDLLMDADKSLFYKAVKSVVWYPVEVDILRLIPVVFNKMEGFTRLSPVAINRMEGFTKVNIVAFKKMEGFTSMKVVAFLSGITED